MIVFFFYSWVNIIVYENLNNIVKNGMKEKWIFDDELIFFGVKSWYFSFFEEEFRVNEWGEERRRDDSKLFENREGEAKSC